MSKTLAGAIVATMTILGATAALAQCPGHKPEAMLSPNQAPVTVPTAPAMTPTQVA